MATPPPPPPPLVLVCRSVVVEVGVRRLVEGALRIFSRLHILLLFFFLRFRYAWALKSAVGSEYMVVRNVMSEPRRSLWRLLKVPSCSRRLPTAVYVWRSCLPFFEHLHRSPSRSIVVTCVEVERAMISPRVLALHDAFTGAVSV